MQTDTSHTLSSYVFGKFTHSVAASAWHDAHAQAQARTIPTYLSLFIFGLAYEILLAYDALRLENTIQVAGICLYNAGLLIEAAVQYDQIRDTYDFLRLAPQPQTQPQPLIGAGFLPAVRGSILAVPVVLGVGTLGMSYVAWKLYKEYQWSIFENISVDLKVRRRYLTYQVNRSSPSITKSNLQRKNLSLPYAADHGLPDLYCAAQIRLLLLPLLHHSVPRRRPRDKGL